MTPGYMGKILFVDLSRGQFSDELLEEKFCRDYIGGYGFGARIILDRQKAGADPLGPDNIFGIVTGPLTGTPMLGSTRYTVVGKSPLTGGWGDANSGGDFGPNLKFSGYDGVFFSGIAAKPVYLFIKDGKPELRDAAHLWGKDTVETEDILKKELGAKAHAVCIGPSGEKLCRIAAVINNKGRAAARSGLGAVMGSKKLKAVAVIGNMEVPLAEQKKADELRRKCVAGLGGPIYSMFRNYGTTGATARAALNGDSPVKNWGGVGIVDFPDPIPINGDAVKAHQVKRYACWRCPVGCGGHMQAGTEYEYDAGSHKPEYETMAAFGTMCLNNNVESIIKANDICNRFGLDTISAGSTIAFAIECYENGLITGKDTGGIELTWGNHQAIVAMTEKLARREGFGAVLADGVKIAAERLGKGAEQYAMHIQGQELPMHDPKFEHSYLTTYWMDATPARHTQGSEGRAPSEITPHFEPKSFRGRGEARRIGSSFRHILNCLGVCYFMEYVLPGKSAFIEFLNIVTGWDMTMEELLETGERIANLRQAFNVREGLNPLQFRVPERMLGRPPQEKGPLAGITVDNETMAAEYLAAADWDPGTAKPSKQKLLGLGLDDLAEELWPSRK